MGSIDF